MKISSYYQIIKLCLEFKFCGFQVIALEDTVLFILFTKPQVLLFIFFFVPSISLLLFYHFFEQSTFSER